tara:strand:- start:95995 stop:96567 length:573 start_codon:yes stop_codon:yes gene_type:complete
MLDLFVQLDTELFYFINRQLSQSDFNAFFRVFTNLHHLRWISAGIFPLLLIFWVFKQRKQGLLRILGLIFVVGTADAFSFRIVKQHSYRARPSQNPSVASILKVSHNPKSSSFPSNHAMNMGAMAATLTLFFPRLVFFWWGFAGLIAFSRVYVGVHFPSDVVAGLIFGWMWFRLWYWVWDKGTLLKRKNI